MSQYDADNLHDGPPASHWDSGWAPGAWRLSMDDAEAVDDVFQQVISGDVVLDEGVLGSSKHGKSENTDGSRRRQGVSAWLALIGLAPAEEPPEDLAARTIRRIEQYRDGERVAGRIGTGGGSGYAVAFRWPELIGVAAVLLIGVSLVWPLLSQARVDARRTECQNQLATAGQALTSAATDNRQALPRYDVEPGAPWWQVGQPMRPDGTVRSNSAQLLLMARMGYTQAETFACPGNPYALTQLPEHAIDYPHHSAVSYSYQTQFTADPVRVDRVPDMAILADRNPLLQIAQQQVQFVNRWGIRASTRMHGGIGQNVLQADGTVTWTTDAVMPDGDNIWLPEGETAFRTFREQPTREHDAVLVP